MAMRWPLQPLRGAAALLVDHRLDIDVAQIVVPDTRQAMGWLAATFFGHPSRSLTLVGVTGTNGKTTTTSFIASILPPADRPVRSERSRALTPHRNHRTSRHASPNSWKRESPQSSWRSPRTPSSCSASRVPFRHRRVHQPRSRSPRSARHRGALLRGEGQAVPARSVRSRRGQHRRSARPAVDGRRVDSHRGFRSRRRRQRRCVRDQSQLHVARRVDRGADRRRVQRDEQPCRGDCDRLSRDRPGHDRRGPARHARCARAVRGRRRRPAVRRDRRLRPHPRGPGKGDPCVAPSCRLRGGSRRLRLRRRS